MIQSFIHSFIHSYSNDAIRLAASLEVKCSHPLSAAIVQRFSGCLSGKTDDSGAVHGLSEVEEFQSLEGMCEKGKNHFFKSLEKSLC